VSDSIVVLGPQRHSCNACGMCCFGHMVMLADEAEAAAVESHGEALGVANPVVDGALRFEDGRCVFLDDRRLCRIHGQFGAEAKPLRCQQFPLKGVTTEDGRTRVAVDPACGTGWKTWRDGPVVDVPDDLMLQGKRCSPPEVGAEKMMIAYLSSPGASVGGYIQLLAGIRPSGNGLPPGFAGRLARRARTLRLEQFLQNSEIGAGFREPVSHLPEAIDGLDPDAPPAWPVLDAEAEAFTLDLIRRCLFLRAGALNPLPHGIGLFVSSGAVLAGWANPDLSVYGPAMAAWARMVRFRAFWLRMAESPEALRHLAMG
jgi:Fe-S-cluster containining protein